jgi:hypothetical protein
LNRAIRPRRRSSDRAIDQPDAVALCDEFASARSSGRHRDGSVWYDRGWRCQSRARRRSIAANPRSVAVADRLTARFPLAGACPCRDGLLGHPHRQAATPDQRGVVFRPVRDPVSGLGDRVAAALVELVTGWISPASGGQRPYRHSVNLAIRSDHYLPYQKHNLWSIRAPTGDVRPRRYRRPHSCGSKCDLLKEYP